MNTMHSRRWTARSTVSALLAGSAIAQAIAATAAPQTAAPSALQPAEPAFGATTERGDASAASKTPKPSGLQPAPGLSLQALPALAPAQAAAKGALSTKSNVSNAAKNLFDMEDRATITVDGKQTTAGELKRKLNAEIAAKAGPPKTVKSGPRKLDLAAINVISAKKSTATMAHLKAGNATLAPQLSVLLANQDLTQTREPAKTGIAGMTIDKAGSYSSQNCLDKGPPVISEIKGALKVGGRVAVWGRCFGDRPGRVEIIGQFPGGKLQAAFTSWDSGAVTIAIPGNVSGATDHTVAVSLVTADGKMSPAMQASFVAARERVDVPDRLWLPDNRFARVGTSSNRDPNPAASGELPMRLRVNPQCALDNMEVTTTFGAVGWIRGWDMGPANEASVTIGWTGICDRKARRVETSFVVHLSVDYSYEWACRASFQARAWAYCPVGIAP